MTTEDKSNSISKTDPPQQPLSELKGSEQHHDLKNQPGKEGDPDLTESDAVESEVEALVEGAVSDSEEDTTMAAALKKAVK